MSFFKRLFSSQKKPEKQVSLSQEKIITRESKSISVCPYCSEKLEKKPVRKKKCPHCGNYIFVRKGKLITENQKKVYLFSESLQSLGVTVKTFNSTKKELIKEWGREPCVNDVFWRILNVQVTKQKGLTELEMIYREMCSIAKEENKDPSTYLEQVRRIQTRKQKQILIGHKEMNGFVTGVVVSGINDIHGCDYCKSISSKKYSIDQALEEMPIPGNCTSEEGCRCVYIAVFKGDKPFWNS